MTRASVALMISSGLMAFEPQPPEPPQPPQARVAIAGNLSGSYLGIGVAEVTQERAQALQLTDEHGVEITRVEEDSPAAKAGLRQGDVVLDYNGQRIEGVEMFMRVVRETPPGREVKLAISRGGSPQTIAVRTGSRKTWIAGKQGEATVELPRIQLPDVRMPDVPRAVMSWRSSILGVETESLDTQLAEYFGVKEGVLVRSVVKGSAGDRAGLRAGDVITRVEDAPVATSREITAEIRRARAKKSASLTVVREKRELSLNLPIEGGASEMHYALPKPAPRP